MEHCCCTPLRTDCSVYCVESLRDEGIEPVSFVQPQYPPLQGATKPGGTPTSSSTPVTSVWSLLVRRIRPAGVCTPCGRDNDRRVLCYTCRLEETARFAAEHGFYRLLHHLAGQPLSGPRRHLPRGGQRLAEQYGRPLPVPGFPRPVPADRLRQGAGTVYAK